MFTLAVSSLTASNLPWLMALTLQVPVPCCSLQHRTLLSPPDAPTTRHHLCFGSASSFLLELFLHSSPAAYQTPPDLGGSSFIVISFCLSCYSWGSQGKNATVVCHSFLQWPMFQRVDRMKTSIAEDLGKGLTLFTRQVGVQASKGRSRGPELVSRRADQTIIYA